MNTHLAWKIAAPMFVLGLLLLALGVFAAWNVHEQHQTSSEIIAREVQAVIAIAQIEMRLRDVRYQVNLFLRTRERRRLERALAMEGPVRDAIAHVEDILSFSEYECAEIRKIGEAFGRYWDEFRDLTAAATGPDADRRGPTVTDDEIDPDAFERLGRLTDESLTREEIEPIRLLIEHDEEVVRKTNEESRATALHLRIGFLLLGICGGGAGLLMGMGIARTIWRSIVQLDVSVRTAVGKLADAAGPVTFSHSGDSADLDAVLKGLEEHIAQVVERLNRQERELLRSEQLARVGQLAAGLAHELRNPLMPMKMLVQAALERGEEGGLRGRSLTVIDQEISRLERAIQTFLDFARPPAMEKAPADLRRVIGQTLELIAGRAGQQSVVVRSRLPEAPVVARVDASQIRQLVLNLLLNALDALPKGGTIEVALEAGVAGPGPVAHRPDEFDAPGVPDGRATPRPTGPARSRPPSAWLAITVADDGAGIDPDQIENIFAPFVTSKETGTGLGLSICRRIASAHQGTLVARNRPTGGAEFTLLIPQDD